VFVDPREVIEFVAALRVFRFTNTALDVLFYDVEVLRLSLLAKDTLIHTSLAVRSASHPFDFP
jgi:hypothetical protein